MATENDTTTARTPRRRRLFLRTDSPLMTLIQVIATIGVGLYFFTLVFRVIGTITAAVNRSSATVFSQSSETIAVIDGTTVGPVLTNDTSRVRELSIEGLHSGTILWLGSAEVVEAALAFILALLLLRFLDQLVAGEPFSRRTVRYFVIGAVATIVLGTGRTILFAVSNTIALDEMARAGYTGLGYSANVIDAIPLAAGGVLLALAAAFDRGRRLREETRGLV